MNQHQDFKQCIIIDDDPVNNFICRQLIELHVNAPVSVLDFTVPEEALAYISGRDAGDMEGLKTLLLLDVNTATMSAWQFLDKFAGLPEPVKSAFSIYVISASLDTGDHEKAQESPYVKDYLVKPLSPESLGEIFKKQQAL